jgi:hypothetical protein
MAVLALGLSLVSAAPAGADQSTNPLNVGRVLNVGETMVSANGQYYAVLQGDGNFVVYGPHGPLWATRTAGATMLVVQPDGNIVLYAGAPGSYRPVWATGTTSLSPVFLVMQDDGNLVAYNAVQPLWSSYGGRGTIQAVNIGQDRPIYSPSGQFMAVVQGDGNFVVYRLDAQRPTPLWASGTGGTGAGVLSIQGDGNVVLYAGGRPVWATSTGSGSVVNLAMQDDGNLVLYAGDRPLWASGSNFIAVILGVAHSQLGYSEDPVDSGCNVFTAFFGRGSTDGCAPGTASESWCSDFLSWVWLSAGAGIDGIGAWSYDFVSWGIAHGTFKQGPNNHPLLGDAVLWGDMDQEYGTHVALVVAVRKDGWIRVISGNDGNSGVSESGYFDPATDAINGYPIVGYTSPLPAALAALPGAALQQHPAMTQEQINSQH